MIYVFRHGKTDYKQGNSRLAIGQGNDLTTEGESVVRASASHLAENLSNTERGLTIPIKIQSSPMGRCLHTSDLIGSVLDDFGFNVLPIEINENLEEVRNFEYGLFLPLVNGGKTSYQGLDFVVDKALTNPGNLGSNMYFRTDAGHTLSSEARKSLPKEYFDRVMSFEKYAHITSRMGDVLNSTASVNGFTHVLSTHEALTGALMARATANLNACLARGRYLSIMNGDPYLSQGNDCIE